MGPYEDIIHLPHHISMKHPQMPVGDRAAQFSSFAALTGYEDEVWEAARITDKKIVLSEEQQSVLDEHLHLLEDALSERPEATFTYFMPDKRKDGGAYISVTGTLKKMDRLTRNILLTNGAVIPVDDLLQVDSSLWCKSFEQSLPEIAAD